MTVETIFVIFYSAFVFASPWILKSKHGNNVSALQSTVVSFGILGTFIGIAAGMYKFDPNNIQGSIPILLEGLKVAFITPIVGMATSLLLKAWPNIFGIRETGEVTQGEELQLILEELRTMSKGLTGDGDTTLLTQIQKLRTSVADKQDELNSSFKEFAAKMAEDNKASLIEALKEVIRDFNTKINEQFGENFRHLNEGVGKMLEWQSNYTRQVESAVEILESASKMIENSKVSLETSAAVMERSVQFTKEFNVTAEELKDQLETMGASMTGMKALADSLKDGGKQIRDSMEEITKQSIATLGSRLVSISEKLAEDYGRVQEAISRINRGA